MDKKRDWRKDGLVRRDSEKADGSTQDPVKTKRVFVSVVTAFDKASESVPDYNDLHAEVPGSKKEDYLPEEFTPGTLKIDPKTPILKVPEDHEIFHSVKEPISKNYGEKKLKRDDLTMLAGIISAVRKNEYTQKEVAEGTGLTVTGYANIERGDVSPSLETLRKICKFLEIKITINGKEI